MAVKIGISFVETIAFSTSEAAVNILRNGSGDLLVAFSHGAFIEQKNGVQFRVPHSIPSVLNEIGQYLFLLQLDALEQEVKSLGIQIVNE